MSRHFLYSFCHIAHFAHSFYELDLSVRLFASHTIPLGGMCGKLFALGIMFFAHGF
jgi:hypothetical protein